MTRTYTTTLTRLTRFVFVAMLVFTALTTTGCGLVDSNDSEEITIERVLVEEPAENIVGQMSDGSQTAEDDGSSSGSDPLNHDAYGNPIKDVDY